MSIDRASGKKTAEPNKYDEEKEQGKSSSVGEKKSPRMKTVAEKNTLAVHEEDDGSILKSQIGLEKKGSFRNFKLPNTENVTNEIDSDDDSSDEDQAMIAMHLKNKFLEDKESYGQDEAKRKRDEEKRNRRETMARDINKEMSSGKGKKDLSKLFDKSPRSPKNTKSPPSTPRGAALSTAPRLTVRKSEVADQPENSSALPPVSPRSRSSNAPKFFRDISQRLSLVSGSSGSDSAGAAPHIVMTKEMTNELVGVHWDFVARQGQPDFSKIPAKVLNDLADLSYKIRNNDTYKAKSPEDQKVYMRRELGRRFIGALVAEAGEDFDNAVLGSTKKMRSYLKETCGILIAAPAEKRKSMIFSEENSSNSSKNSARDPDFLDHLQKNVEARMNNYQIDLVIDLNSVIDSDFIQKAKAAQFVSNYGTDKISMAANQRKDVSGSFVRDFPNSHYFLEDEQGNLKKISTIDEFVAAVGDPEKNGLPYLISHFSNQNLPVFLRNLFFGRTNESGDPVSVLRLHDGTPLNMAVSPNATYTIKKLPDGGISLKYEGKVDTTGTSKLGRNAAYVLKKEKNKETGKEEIIRTPVVIEGATSTWSQEVIFKANGLWELKNPRFQAKGWNRVNG